MLPSSLLAADLNEGAAAACSSAQSTPATAQPRWLQVVTQVKQSKILIVSLPELGHLNPVLNLGRELAQRGQHGHRVTLATCAFLLPKIAKQCEEAGIQVQGLATHVCSPESAGSHAATLKTKGDTMKLYDFYNQAMLEPLRDMASKTMPDVIVADFMTWCAFEVGDARRTPVCVNFADPVVFKLLGPNPSPLLALSFAILGPLMMGSSLLDGRCYSRLIGHIGDSIYSRLCLVNSFMGLQPVTCVPPNVVFTGPTGPRSEGEVTETSLKELNDWIVWVRQEKLRVVYVTFGSMVQLSPAQVRSIYEGLAAIQGIAVAWSLKEAGQQHLPVLPQRFFVHHWFPQLETLRLSDVVAVISHCGFGGLNEIIMAGRPIVAVPFMGDQPLNAQEVKRHGLGEIVIPRQMTAKKIQHAVQLITKEPSYTENAKKLQAALLTSGGAPFGAMHIELLSNFGAKHYTRRPVTLVQDVAKKACVALVVGGFLLAFTDHMRRIFRSNS